MNSSEKIKGTGCLATVLIGIPIGLFLIIIVLWAWFSYNRMVSREESVSAQWAQVENTYQRRADLIDNLVETVKGYATHEYRTLTDVTEARAQINTLKIGAEQLDEKSLNAYDKAQGGLTSAFSRLLAIVEQYPDLKANQGFLQLQSQLEQIENTILIQRNAYNEAARKYNIFIRKFPNNLFAALFGFDPKGYFKAEQGAEQAAGVDF
ncbi:MAG: LemA family protein [Bacteroidia bacterium]|nr:LemA family protein [Bacteroidia bacterium]